MNLLRSVKVSTIFTSTSAAVGSTGPVAALSTAASSGGDSTTATGIPFGSTGLDMQGYDGVVFIASVTGSSAGPNFLRAAWSAVSSTDAITNFTEYPTAHVKGNSSSTVYDKLVLDVVRPVKRYIAAIVGVSATSEVVLDITAIQYVAGKSPVTSTSTGYFLSGTATAVGTT